MEFVAVAAVADNLAIGIDGELPWESHPADKRQYRERVADSVVILGRLTFESMRDDFPGRRQIVLTRDPSYEPGVESAIVATDFEMARSLAEADPGEVAYVLGGAAIYELAMPHLDRMVLSRIPGAYDATRFFPQWRRDGWALESTTDYETFRLEEWVRDRA